MLYCNLNSYPRYAGPREALLHAIIRKNYGCTHFLVGRDHAGYKNYYYKYESQQKAITNEKKIGIKIINFNEPVACLNCKKIFSNKCTYCNTTTKFLRISGTYIRNLILKNKKIPEIMMSKKISKGLNQMCILKK